MSFFQRLQASAFTDWFCGLAVHLGVSDVLTLHPPDWRSSSARASDPPAVLQVSGLIPLPACSPSNRFIWIGFTITSSAASSCSSRKRPIESWTRCSASRWRASRSRWRWGSWLKRRSIDPCGRAAGRDRPDPVHGSRVPRHVDDRYRRRPADGLLEAVKRTPDHA